MGLGRLGGKAGHDRGRSDKHGGKQGARHQDEPEDDEPNEGAHHTMAQPGTHPKLQAAVTKLLDQAGAEPGLAGDIRDYVLTGTPVSALARVANTSSLHPALGFAEPWERTLRQSVYHRVYQAIEEVPPAVAIRWARLLEAIVSQAMPLLLSMPPVAGGRWAEALLLHAGAVFPDNRRLRGSAGSIPVQHQTLEQMLVAAGADPADLLVEGFRQADPEYHHPPARVALQRMRGYDLAVRRHAEALRPVIRGTRAKTRLVALEMLASARQETQRLFVAELAELATSTSREARDAASSLLAHCDRGDLTAALQNLAQDGPPETRRRALAKLWSGGTGELRGWALKQAAGDRAPQVRALADEWGDTERAERLPEEPFEVPLAPVIDWSVPATPEVRGRLAQLARDINADIDRENEAEQARAREEQQRAGRAFRRKPYRRLPDNWPDLMARELERRRPPRMRTGVPGHWVVTHALSRRLTDPACCIGFGPVGVVIVLHDLGALLTSRGEFLLGGARQALQVTHEHCGGLTPLRIAAMLDAIGAPGGRVVFDWYQAWDSELRRHWPAEEIAEFVAAHLDLVTDCLEPGADSSWSYSGEVEAPYRALATLPVLPRDVADILFAQALGPRVSIRRFAQDALSGRPGAENRAMAALSDGKSAIRTAAAQWLGRLRYVPAVPALETALARERHDVAKAALLDALEALGQPPEKYLDRDGLAEQAAAALARGFPKQLDWLDWDRIPAVRWTDSGAAVPVVVLRWLAAQAVKAKSPEPNALLRRYSAMWDRRDREEFAQVLLEAWIAEDVCPIGLVEARRRAEEDARYRHHEMAWWPEGFRDDPLFGASVEELTEAFLPSRLRDPTGSAISSKGLLALVAACGGERVAPAVAAYLKEWYGNRTAQGKALIGVLAWVEHPSATQLLLSVRSRFRTRSFQEEADRHARALAERHGWSMAELADRTIPTAGFDESGTLELGYGSRVFTARLRADLTIALHSPDGKQISALPPPRQSDDPDDAREARKALTAARKELKTVVKLQTERLYEAFCTRRGWRYEDWERYLHGHPVLRHLVRRLAWIATESGRTQVFRPLEDGTLTSLADEEITPAPDAVIAVAHDTNVDADTARAWPGHFDDYEVTPLFQQFGRVRFTLPGGMEQAGEYTGFRGHLLEAFTLRGQATRLGYSRGDTLDGGFFTTYEKRFPALGLSTVIEFSGSHLPVTNLTVALLGLCFTRDGGANDRSETIRLGEVPAVLLAEAYADIASIAAAGTGYDPGWEKKVEF